MARTARWYQAANPLETSIVVGTGGGTTSGDPAAFSIAAYISALNSGYDVYLNRGGIIQPPTETETTTSWNLLNAAPTNLGRVFLWDGIGGLGANLDPFTFDAGVYDAPVGSGAGGWTYLSANRWTKDFTFDSNPNLRAAYSGARAGQQLIVPRTELCKRSSQATCTDYGDWYVSGTTTSTVTICTSGGSGEANSPARVFDGLALVGNQARWSSALWFSDAQRLEFVDPVVCMHGGMRFRPLNGTGVVSDIWMNQPEVHYYVANSIRFETPTMTNATGGNYRIRLVRPTVDSGSTPFADQKDYASITNYDGVQHCLSIWGQTSDVSVVDPTFLGGRHAIIEVQSDRTVVFDTTNNWPRNVEIYGTRPGSATAVGINSETSYCRFAGCATEGGWRIENFECSGFNVRSQITGRGRFAHNYMHTWQRCLVKKGIDDNGGVDGGLLISENGSRGISQDVSPKDVVIQGNILENVQNWPITIGFSFDAIMPAGAVKILDNTVIDTLYFNDRKLSGQTTSGKTAATLTAASSGTFRITNNSGGAPGYLSAQVWKNNLVIAPSDNIFVDGTQASGGGANGAGIQISSSVNGAFAEDSYTASGQQRYDTTAAAGLGSTYIPSTSSGVVGLSNDTTPRLDKSGKVRSIPGSVGALEPA